MFPISLRAAVAVVVAAAASRCGGRSGGGGDDGGGGCYCSLGSRSRGSSNTGSDCLLQQFSS